MQPPVANRATTTPNVPLTSRPGLRPGRVLLLTWLALVMMVPTVALTTAAMIPAVGAPAAAPHMVVHAPGTGPTNVGRSLVGQPVVATVAPRVAAEAAMIGGALPAGLRGTAGPSPLVVHPDAGSSNYVISSDASSTSIAQVGPSNTTLVGGISSSNDYTNGSALNPNLWNPAFKPSGYLWQHGLTYAEMSSNGGQTWKFDSPGLNKSWVTPSSATYTDLPAGGPIVAGNSSGGAVLIEPFFAFCEIFVGNPDNLLQAGFTTPWLYCNDTATSFEQPGGVAIAHSPNNGLTWGQPAVLWQSKPYVNLSVNFGGCGPLYYYLNGNFTSGLQIYSDPTTSTVVAAWTEIYNDYAGDIGCQTVNGALTYVFNQTPTQSVFEMMSYSSDGGVTWSTPTSMSDNGGEFTALGGSTAGTHTDYLAFYDFANSSASTGTVPIDFASSTTGGASWTTPVGIGYITPVTALAYYSNFPGFGAAVKLAVDNNAGSPYYGSVYVAYPDNRSNTNGYPSIAVMYSRDGGSTWSQPDYVTPNTPQANQFVIPAIAVDAAGNVIVSFYESNLANGNYVEDAAVSTDGGNTWTLPFGISDQVSVPPGTSSGLPPFGDTTGLVATNVSLYFNWLDCRLSGCTSPTLGTGWSSLVAQVHEVAITSNAPGGTASVTSLGTTNSIVMNGTAYLEYGAAGSIQVPSVLPDDVSDVYAFSGFTGAVTAVTNPASFTYTGGNLIVANYIPAPSAWITGHVGPIVPQLQVTIGSTIVALSPYNATEEQFNLTVEAGPSYSGTVSAGIAYTAQPISVTTTAHVASFGDYFLGRTYGYLNGSISAPPGAVVDNTVVTINGSVIQVQNGLFSSYRPWGIYLVTATLPGYTSYSQTVSLAPHGFTRLPISLGGGYLNGSVDPAGANVAVNGAPVLTSGGAFSLDMPGGTYTVTADLNGYSFYKWNYTVTPGQQTLAQIKLGTSGWLTGSVTPSTASIKVDGTYQSVTSAGGFNVTITGNNAHVSLIAIASGYKTFYENFSVTVGNVTPTTVAMTPTTSQQHCPDGSLPPCPQPTGGNKTTPVDNTLLYVLLGVLIAVVAAVGLVIAMRRRPGSGASAPAPPPPSPETYDGSSPGELPKMQSDGSMGHSYDEGEPPQQ